eukprot:5012914-Prymnesium_polylepis.2
MHGARRLHRAERVEVWLDAAPLVEVDLGPPRLDSAVHRAREQGRAAQRERVHRRLVLAGVAARDHPRRRHPLGRGRGACPQLQAAARVACHATPTVKR